MNTLISGNNRFNTGLTNNSGFANNGYGNFYGNQGFDLEQITLGVGNFIINHKYAISGLILLIPIIIITIIGFSRKNYQLAFTSISFLITVFVLIGSIAYKTVKAPQMILLIILLFVEFGLIVYFLTKLPKKVNKGMYLDFYTPATYSQKNGIPLSLYGLDNNEKLKELMKGTSYGFALKEDMPIDLGAEGTYSFWLKVCPDNFNKGNTNWRTVWYRGDINTSSIYQMKTPGVYLAPNTNKLIITVACENGPDEGNAIVLDDIPLNNWFCTTIVLDGRSLDCYVNGLLERSISLTGMPMMMNSNLVKGKNGFNGLIAFFRYNSGAIEPHNVKKLYEREKATMEGNEYDLEVC